MMRLLALPLVAGASFPVKTKEIAPGVNMPIISIGCGGLERKDAEAIAETWLKLGGRGIDTAHSYGVDAIKDAIEASGVERKDMFITTKVPGCSAQDLSYIDSDIQTLGAYVDLLLIHRPDGDCVNAWKTLEDYHAKGKAKAIGVSNFKTDDLKTILAVATTIPAVNQIELNIVEKDMNTIDFSTKHGITVEAFSPLGRSGQSGDISGNAVIKKVASSHNVSTYQVALKWILQHDWMLTFQSASEEHQASDADVFNFTITDAEMRNLDGVGQPSIVV